MLRGQCLQLHQCPLGHWLLAHTQRHARPSTCAADRRASLRLVITSATLDGEKFSAFFTECPVLSIPGRCFPVQVRHALETPKEEYRQLAMDKALDLHLTEGDGDILVFLTGQAEIEQVWGPLEVKRRAL